MYRSGSSQSRGGRVDPFLADLLKSLEEESAEIMSSNSSNNSHSSLRLSHHLPRASAPAVPLRPSSADEPDELDVERETEAMALTLEMEDLRRRLEVSQQQLKEEREARMRLERKQHEFHRGLGGRVDGLEGALREMEHRAELYREQRDALHVQVEALKAELKRERKGRMEAEKAAAKLTSRSSGNLAHGQQQPTMTNPSSSASAKSLRFFAGAAHALGLASNVKDHVVRRSLANSSSLSGSGGDSSLNASLDAEEKGAKGSQSQLFMAETPPKHGHGHHGLLALSLSEMQISPGPGPGTPQKPLLSGSSGMMGSAAEFTSSPLPSVPTLRPAASQQTPHPHQMNVNVVQNLAMSNHHVPPMPFFHPNQHHHHHNITQSSTPMSLQQHVGLPTIATGGSRSLASSPQGPFRLTTFPPRVLPTLLESPGESPSHSSRIPTERGPGGVTLAKSDFGLGGGDASNPFLGPAEKGDDADWNPFITR